MFIIGNGRLLTRGMPNKLIEKVVTELRKSVKGFRLTDKTMTADCPNCENSWCGQSYYEQYKEYYEKCAAWEGWCWGRRCQRSRTRKC